jgi:hypothetical protein
VRLVRAIFCKQAHIGLPAASEQIGLIRRPVLVAVPHGVPNSSASTSSEQRPLEAAPNISEDEKLASPAVAACRSHVGGMVGGAALTYGSGPRFRQVWDGHGVAIVNAPRLQVPYF